MINYYEYSIVENEHLYGPGKRLLIFLQGCSIHCEGCINSHLWEFGTGKDASTDEIVNLCLKNKVEGVTLHGGEPLDQAEGLYPLVNSLKKTGFTIILFTGYSKKELNSTQRQVWELADLIICGKFDIRKRNVYLQFRGSTNQRVIRRNGKYKNYKIKDGKTVAILSLELDGTMNIKGFYTEDVDELHQLIKI